VSKWWKQKPMRMIQTNLREIDAGLDVDEYIQKLKEFSADVVLFNVGGIVANYPTKLPFHYRNPYLNGDLVGKVLNRVKQEGIRFIARFDFSKVNQVLADQHPEWLYMSAAGEVINYNGQVHTCINGRYQQEHCLEILEEVIDNYLIDGVFFNMAGYVTTDYSGNYHGICQCDNCKQAFYERYGHPLPLKEDINDPVFRLYDKFREETSRELFHKICRFIKGKNENIAIALWAHEGVDIFRSESNTAIDRPLPEWNYSAGHHVKMVLGSWDHMVPSNTAVHFVDFPFRHSSVSPNLTAVRIAQSIVYGAWPDYYVIGTLSNQDDRLCFDAVKQLFGFHKQNEEYYTDIESISDVCLVVPSKSTHHGSMKEFRGIYRILTESHILFDLIHDGMLSDSSVMEKLKKYKTLILPDMRNMSDAVLKNIESYVSEGGNVLVTGRTSTYDAQGNSLDNVMLACTGVRGIRKMIPREKGMYFRVRTGDKEVLNGFEDLDIIYLYDDFMELDVDDDCEKYLAYIPTCMFGPPEKCYYAVETTIPGMISKQYGKGKCVFIPWSIGKHYESLSNHAHSMLLVGALRDLLQVKNIVSADVSPLVELASHIQKDGKWQLVSLVNHSGQLGTGFFEPLTIYDIPVRLKVDRPVTGVKALYGGMSLNFHVDNGSELSFTLPRLELFETIVIEFS